MMNRFRIKYLMDVEAPEDSEYVEGRTDEVSEQDRWTWEALMQFLRNPDVQQTLQRNCSIWVWRELFWGTDLEEQQREDALNKRFDEIYNVKLDSYIQAWIPKTVAERKARYDAEQEVVRGVQYAFTGAKTWIIDNNYTALWGQKWAAHVVESRIWGGTADILIPWAEKKADDSTVEIWELENPES